MAKIIIENFMTSGLGLSGNQLVLFAHLWAESKHGQDVIVNDYAHYSGAINVTIPTYYSTVNALIKRGVVERVGSGRLQIKRN